MVACALAYPADKSDLLDAYLRFHAVECRPFGTPLQNYVSRCRFATFDKCLDYFVNRRLRYFVTVPISMSYVRKGNVDESKIELPPCFLATVTPTNGTTLGSSFESYSSDK